MARIEVYFVGVCTHVRRQVSMVGEHRVLLVDAWNGDHIKDHDIGVHEAWLRYGPSKSERVALHGVSITIEGAPRAASYDPTFDSCVERAVQYAPDLPSLDEDVLRPAGSAKLAAIFTCGGRYYGGVHDKASIAMLEVDAKDPVLTITPFEGGERQTIALREGARLQIENLGSKKGNDEDYDFLLHYRVGTALPEKVDWPREPKDCNELTPPYPHNTAGPGCANSTYP